MTAAGDPTPAQQNLIDTYLTLARQVPHSAVTQARTYAYSVSPKESRFSNFGIATAIDRDTALHMAMLTRQRPVFPVFALTDQVASELLSVQLGESYEMVQFERAARRSSCEIDLDECYSIESRRRAADFMMEQFFRSQSASFREELSLATANAPGFRLFTRLDRNELEAAVLIRESGDLAGLYNLCVAGDRRKRGTGSRIVEWVAATIGKPLVLQCGVRLEPWYRSLGFEETGRIRVFGR